MSDRSFQCPICSGHEWRPSRTLDSHLPEVPQGLTRPRSVHVELGRCDGCGIEFNRALLAGQNFRELYEDEGLYSSTGYAYRRDIYPKYTVDVLAELNRQAPSRGRILEIGFLDTDLLRRLNTSGWQVEGTDLDLGAVESARRAGWTAHCADITDKLFDRRRYEAVLAIAVLEHVEDPRRFVARVQELLVPGGLVLLQLPNVRSFAAWISSRSRQGWDMYTEPGHLYHYRRDHLESLLEKAGFGLAFYRTATIRVRGKVPLLPWRIPRLEHRVASLLHRSNACLALYTVALRSLDLVGLGDTHVILGKKPESA